MTRYRKRPIEVEVRECPFNKSCGVLVRPLGAGIRDERHVDLKEFAATYEPIPDDEPSTSNDERKP